MIPADPYGATGDGDELPQLPIPRPGEWSPMASGVEPQVGPREDRRVGGDDRRIAPPSLGAPLGRKVGGGSFTAAGGDEDPTDDTHPGLGWSHAERERMDSERFTWELAARLTSGMLANPARSNSSVKDAMGLFDQFLQEMHAYTKIASEFDLLGSESQRRREHEEYFHKRGAAASSSDTSTSLPVPPPTAAAPKPEPTQPRPIPPGARPYAPGSMAGAPPPPEQPGEGDQAA